MGFRVWKPPKNLEFKKTPKDYVDTKNYKSEVLKNLVNEGTKNNIFFIYEGVGDYKSSKVEDNEMNFFHREEEKARKREVLYLILTNDYGYKGERDINTMKEFKYNNNIEIDWLSQRYSILLDYQLGKIHSYNAFLEMIKLEKEGKNGL